MSTQYLLGYYVAFGFCIFLAWAGFIGDELTRQLEETRRRRYQRAAGVLSVIGLLHPALALCGLDIARQLRQLDEFPSARSETTVRRAASAVAASVFVAVACVGVIGT